MMNKTLQNHFVMRMLAPSDLRNDRTIHSASGDRIRFNIYGNVYIYIYKSIDLIFIILYINSNADLLHVQITTVNGHAITAQPQLDSANLRVYLIEDLLNVLPSKTDHIIDVLAANIEHYHMLIHAIHITGLTVALEEGALMA